jgi:hypothetical protein
MEHLQIARIEKNRIRGILFLDCARNLSRPVVAEEAGRSRCALRAARQYDPVFPGRSKSLDAYQRAYFLLENNAISVTRAPAIDTARYACFIRGEIARFRLREPIKNSDLIMAISANIYYARTATF